eukprot:GHVU01015478.1.p4 GENE.GHVU01015478.1~~GHVU01015478.1.p4  ORF type:complete len:113 (-),score=18.39 GHVU01015478.1:14-352(-)
MPEQQQVVRRGAAAPALSAPLTSLPVRIKYTPPSGPGRGRPRDVAVSGSFDDWRVRRPMRWENSRQLFSISVALPPGRYLYKLIVDGDWVCDPGEKMEQDSGGNLNNLLVVM